MSGIQCGVITSAGVIKDENGDDIIDNNGDDNNDNDNRSHIAAQDYKPLLAVNICQGSSQGDKMEHKQVRHGTTFIIILCLCCPLNHCICTFFVICLSIYDHVMCFVL